MDVGHAIRQVLVEEWDPLGIRADPSSHPAYDCYVQDLTLLVLGGGSDADIADYFRGVETDRLRLGGVDEPRLTRVLDALRRATATRSVGA
jgi:hypothetical protein